MYYVRNTGTRIILFFKVLGAKVDIYTWAHKTLKKEGHIKVLGAQV